MAEGVGLGVAVGLGIGVDVGSGFIVGERFGLGLRTSHTMLSLSVSNCLFSLKTAAFALGAKIGPAPLLAAEAFSETPYL